ncbi:MAG: hypothetical protein QM605_01200 [Sphingobium sp.]
MTSEFHWSAYRGGRKRDAYEALIRYAFDLINKRHAALHIIIAEFKGYDHKAKEGENKDTSINRMYFQLFLHRVPGFTAKRARFISAWTQETTAATFARCATSFAPPHMRPTRPAPIACTQSNPWIRETWV